MSGAQVTNYFLSDYSEAQQAAKRAQAEAEGRKLSVKNPLARPVEASTEKKQHWWTHVKEATDPDARIRTSSISSDKRSLFSFSSSWSEDTLSPEEKEKAKEEKEARKAAKTQKYLERRREFEAVQNAVLGGGYYGKYYKSK